MQRCKTFSATKKTVTIHKNKQTNAVNRDILETSLSFSIKYGKVVDFDKALRYPLSSIPLSMCNGDGTKRKTNKSQLAKIILDNRSTATPSQNPIEKTVYIVDMMALLRTMTEIADTFEKLAWQTIKLIPTGHKRVDIVADSYKEISIKSSERELEGFLRK